MQLVNISFRTLLIYRFLFYLLKKYACLFCRVSQSLDFSFIFVVAFNKLLCPLYSLIKLKFNFLAFVSGVVFFHQENLMVVWSSLSFLFSLLLYVILSFPYLIFLIPGRGARGWVYGVRNCLFLGYCLALSPCFLSMLSTWLFIPLGASLCG